MFRIHHFFHSMIKYSIRARLPSTLGTHSPSGWFEIYNVYKMFHTSLVFVPINYFDEKMNSGIGKVVVTHSLNHSLLITFVILSVYDVIRAIENSISFVISFICMRKWIFFRMNDINSGVVSHIQDFGDATVSLTGDAAYPAGDATSPLGDAVIFY
jgi:hypothetical protein